MRAVGLGTQAGEVVLAELPVWISKTQTAGTNLTIHWQGGSGPFQLQRTSPLQPPAWEEVGLPVTGSTVSTWIDSSEALYRVRDLQR